MAGKNTSVKAVLDAYPETIRDRLLELRGIIFDVASTTDGVGPLEETLKWGEPAYLTRKTGSGSTIRIAPVRKSDSKFAVYFNCKTSLLDRFRELYPEQFQFDGNRALVFAISDDLPIDPLKHCIALALTYHRRK